MHFQWIDETVVGIDPAFTTWFRTILLDNRVIVRQFEPVQGTLVSLSSLLTMAGESWLDDDVIRGLMRVFDKAYNGMERNKNILFLEPLDLLQWTQAVAEKKWNAKVWKRWSQYSG